MIEMEYNIRISLLLYVILQLYYDFRYILLQMILENEKVYLIIFKYSKTNFLVDFLLNKYNR